MDVSQLLSGDQHAPVQADIVPGERVRSYDFSGIRDCYAEGVVEAITDPMEGCQRYMLRIEKRVLEGRIVPVDDEYVYPPVNGTPSTFGRVTNFVERIAG
jgi:hypothetical protein